MKKELNTYDPIIGLTEYDDWSYNPDNQMWYVLIFKLGNILNTWKQTIQSAIIQYAMASNKSLSDLHHSEIINYCFPEIKTPVNNVIES